MIYLLLLLEFMKIGVFTFGGGYAMIPIVKETVLTHNWMSESEFYDFIGVCESTPGPIAVNIATYVGSTQGGILGSIVATIGIILPSFIIILLIASILKHFLKNKYVQGFLSGIKPVVLGLILSAGITLFLKNIGYENSTTFHISYASLICFGILLLIMIIWRYGFKKKMNTVVFILLSAAIGIGVCALMKYGFGLSIQ